MRIDLLYVPDCPNLDRARSHLRAALDATEMAVSVREIEVTSPEAAVEAGMLGSPTILIDGADPFATPSTTPSLSCRLFHTPDGLQGAPTVTQLVAVLSG